MCDVQNVDFCPFLQSCVCRAGTRIEIFCMQALQSRDHAQKWRYRDGYAHCLPSRRTTDREYNESPTLTPPNRPPPGKWLHAVPSLHESMPTTPAAVHSAPGHTIGKNPPSRLFA